MTRAWLDGKPLGKGNSLCTPHRYFARNIPAGQHVLVLRVSNVGYPTKGGHLTSPDTQSNWLGITGEVSLEAGQSLLWNVQCEVLPDLRSIRVQACVAGTDMVELSVSDWYHGTAAVIDGQLDIVCRFAQQPPLWSDRQPTLLTLRVTAGQTAIEQHIGLRRMSTEGRKLLLNGDPVYLRGTHDGMAFPLTGAAPTDLPAWRRYFSIIKEWGLNHVRYHTCCPPEAAFAAADELGLLLEP